MVSCSTTKHLPPGELLYTGLRGIEWSDRDSVEVGDEVLDRIEEAFSYPPNNAFLGSSSVRTPFPLGLWVYNANVKRKGALNKWLMNWLASKPILISTVKPETRTKIVEGILRDNGYFNGTAAYEVIREKKNGQKAKIRYGVTFHEPYRIDSIQWRRLQHRADTLLQLNDADRLVHKGDIFSTEKLAAERQRIATIMRNNGYSYFRPEYIVYQADSALSSHKVSLRAGLKQGVPRQVLHPWKIGNIYLALNGYDSERPTDSIRYKEMLIFYEGKLRVRPSVLYSQLKFQCGDLYSLKKQTETQMAMNRLDIFRFTEFRYWPQDTLPACETMNVLINTSYDYPLNGALDLKATVNDSDYAGPGMSLDLTRRNIFGGGEVLTTSIYGSHEWNIGRKTVKNTGMINHFEIGVKGNILFPRLVLPRIGKRAYDFSASTHLDLDINLMNRARYYTMWRVTSGLSYEFHPAVVRHHTFTPFKLVFNKLQHKTQSYDSIVNLNPSLAQSLEDQFIPSIGYTYTLDNAPLRQNRSTTRWQFSVSEAGNLISGVYAAFGKDFNEEKRILGRPYAQFLKATSELRYNHYLDRNQRLVMRIGGGLIYSYGNMKMAPYNERFYVGGANSIRAFTIRSIGPGRFRPDPDNMYAYIDQNGDWKLEANIEYRGRLVGDLDIAVFFDAGNVWLMRRDETRPGGTFQWKHFPNDIALGTGIGFRYDMSMLVFRLDIGYALHYPYDTRDWDIPEGSYDRQRTSPSFGESESRNTSLPQDPAYKGKKRYFNTRSFWDGVGFHIAIGYPF
jgi:outer membrane protein assembly factor BamA